VRARQSSQAERADAISMRFAAVLAAPAVGRPAGKRIWPCPA